MSRPTLLRSATALLAIGLLTFTGALHASGGDELGEDPFMPQWTVPLSEMQAYGTGKPGIVVPSHWRVYHFLAYRSLSGQALSKADLAQLNVQGHKVGPFVSYDDVYSDDKNGVGIWLKARVGVRGAPAVKVGVETDVGDFTNILNCHADAFERASKTLSQRIAQGGPQWAVVWLANQDAVFANCSPELGPGSSGAVVRPLVLPPALPANAPAWLAKDHAYQVAAANFYAGRYEQARTQFLGIAKDAASPWQSMGKYLAARALIRSVNATPGSNESDDSKRLRRDKLVQARNEMAAIAGEYAPAKRMVTWLDLRARPDERRRELTAVLAQGAIGEAQTQMMTDYLYLLDRLSAEAMIAADDPMTAWIGVMQAGSGERHDGNIDRETIERRKSAVGVARAQWDKRHEPVWLVALLTNARKGELKPAEAKAAAAVKPNAPAYVALQFHLARLAQAEGRGKEADAIVSALIEKQSPGTVRNRLLRLKMVTAPTAEASFAAAARQPVLADLPVPVPDEGKPVLAAAQFDGDLASHLNRHLPLTTLVRVRPMLARSEQKSAADLIFTRAVLLGEYAIADGLADDVAQKRATTRHLYERFKTAATPDAKRDAGVLILSNSPELTPRSVRDQADDSSNVNWACESAGFQDDGLELAWPAFVSDTERKQVEKERAQLRKLPKRSSYLIPLVMDWAKNNKADPEGPKALHFLIASTRNECGGRSPDDKSRNYSKEGFEFLHKHFPKSEWAIKTRYYY